MKTLTDSVGSEHDQLYHPFHVALGLYCLHLEEIGTIGTETAHKGDSWKVGRPKSSVHGGACNVTTSLGEPRSYVGLQGGPQVAQGMLEPHHRTALQ